MNEVTGNFAQNESGDSLVSEKLLPLVYDELRKLAASKLAQEGPGLTLQATALVHEAYLRLLGPSLDSPWNSRGHFFVAAAEAMRRILVEQARRKKSIKRGGHLRRWDLETWQIEAPDPRVDLLILDDALGKLSLLHKRQAEVVKLRYFAGLTICQAAEVIGVSESTADADWAYAKSWLLMEMTR